MLKNIFFILSVSISALVLLTGCPKAGHSQPVSLTPGVKLNENFLKEPASFPRQVSLKAQYKFNGLK